jgi:hypothetical protein
MRFFKRPTSTEDRFRRGLLDVLLVLGGVALSGLSFDYAVQSFGWLAGIVDPPAEVLVPAGRGQNLVDYSADVAGWLLLYGLFFGVCFAAGTVFLALEAVGIFRRAGRKTRLARQRKRHARRNSRTEGGRGSLPELENGSPGVPPGPETRL